MYMSFLLQDVFLIIIIICTICSIDAYTTCFTDGQSVFNIRIIPDHTDHHCQLNSTEDGSFNQSAPTILPGTCPLPTFGSGVGTPAA